MTDVKKVLIEVPTDLWARLRDRAYRRDRLLRDLLAEALSRYLEPVQDSPSEAASGRPSRRSIDTSTGERPAPKKAGPRFRGGDPGD